MFFKLGLSYDQAFPVHIELTQSLRLSTDLGWREFNADGARVIFKGYIDDRPMSDIVASEIASSRPFLQGNFVAFIVRGNQVSITHDVFRSCMLFVDNDRTLIHNLPERFDERIPTNVLITVADEFKIVRDWFDPVGPVKQSGVTLDDAVSFIDLTITRRFERFFSHNTLPTKIFISGGIDTLVCWSYLKNLGIDYEIVLGEHLFPSKFVTSYMQQNTEFKKKFWAYDQIHSWEDPAVIVSGAMGDEVLMRGPLTCDWLLSQYGTSITEQLRPEHYHHYYHLLPRNTRYYGAEGYPTSMEEAISKILSMTSNDHQHWHIDETLTFTPFKDIEMTKMLLRLPFNDIIGQIVDAAISKELVRRNAPQLLKHLERYKNQLRPEEINYQQFLADK